MVRQLMQNIVQSGLIITEASIDMDASIIFQNLLDHNAAKRVEILIVMRRLVKNGNGHLPFRNTTKDAVFEVLHHVLDDVRWEVRYQCLLLISAIIPSANEDLDSCMLLVMPKIIANLGHENMNIRRAALQVLHVHMKYTNNLQQFQRMFIQYGLESHDYITRKGCIMSISVLFTSDFANENLYPLVECLSKHFVHGDASLFYPIFLAMQKLNELVGPVTFESYLQKIDVEAVNTYKRVLNKFYFSDSRLTHSLNNNRAISSGNLNRSLGNFNQELFQLEFGLFEPHIIEKIRDEDWKTRIEGLEHMKIVLKEAPDLPEQLTEMDEFLSFLSKLLEDPNFKIVILALGMYELLIDKFRKEIRHFLRAFVLSVLKRLGDSKLVVREHAIKVIHKLMHHVRPTEVLNFLLESKNHRNPRLREEIINRITAGVLTFPSYSFEFSVLCEAVAPLLVDTKRRVRLAALECFAVLAQAMGPTRMIPLVSAVDAVEINLDGEGLLSAVQARLARRILPRCTEDGTVTFAVTLPSSASYQNHGDSPCGADIDWVMAASGSSSSSTPPSRSRETPSSKRPHRDSWSSRSKEVRAPRSSKTYRQSWSLPKKPETPLSASCPDEFVTSNESLASNGKNGSVAVHEGSVQDLENNRSQLSSSSQSSEEINTVKESAKKSEQTQNMWKSPNLSENRKSQSKSPRNSVKATQEQKLPQDTCVTKENTAAAKRIQRGSANFGNRLLPNRLKLTADGTKPRGVSSNSKIPVLATNFVHRNSTTEDSQILLRPTLARTLSAGRQHFLPNHNSRYSASYHKFSNAVVYDNGVKLDYDSDSGNAIMRRVSPDDSPFGSKAILVRSPSLTHLQHIPQRDPRAVTPTSYDSYISTTENMGNVSSYFRPSPGGVIMAQPTPVHLDEDVNVIGVAVLDDSLKPPSSPSPHSWPSAELFKPGSGGSSQNESWHKPVSSMPEVYGVNLNYNFTSPTNPNFSQEIVASINGMDNTNISISKITREKMLKRQQEILKEAEERRLQRERSQQERKQLLERRLQEERERQQRQQLNEDINEDISNAVKAAEEPPPPSEKQNGDLEIPHDNVKPQTPPPPPKTATPNNSSCDSQTGKRTETNDSKEGSAKSLHRSSSLKTPSTVRKFAQLTQSSTKNMSTLSKRNLAASSLALFDDSQNVVSPYPHPDEALKKALKSLSTETWMGKIEGIQTISRLAQVHPNILLPQLHPVLLALLTEVKNLRSSVSRAAILTIGDLFAALKRNMEQDLELVTSTLLNKSGETVGFIRDDIEKVMKHLVEAVTPNKAALAIIAGGASHRNGAVRKTAAQSLLSVVEKMGATRILSTAKDVTERLLPTTAHFVMDAMPLTRYCGRRIFQMLMTHPNFDKLLTRYVQPSTLRNINSILDSVRKKGAGEKPKEGVSARSHKTEVHRSGLLNRTM